MTLTYNMKLAVWTQCCLIREIETLQGVLLEDNNSSVTVTVIDYFPIKAHPTNLL